jgi:hypothetical protein
MKISLNIFTNSTLSAPKTDIIRRTYDSFCDTFGHEYPVTVYCDPKPNFKMSKFYFEELQKYFPFVYKANSLSDGYIKAVNSPYNEDFMFMLEHDWQFNNQLIKHSLEEIAAVMSAHGLYHLRFNKRANVVSGWDIGLKEKKCFYSRELELTYCETSVLSNNPHIIDVKKYREKCLPLLQIKPGSKGIEENLTHVGLTGCIYGGRDYPATVKHIDGRRSR